MLEDEAFEAFYKEHQPGLLRFVASRIRDRHGAQDVVQEVYAKAYRNRARFDESRPFATWIYAIARNACVDHLRRRGRDPLAAGGPWAPAPPPDLEGAPALDSADPALSAQREELLALVRRELAGMPDHRRAAVEMKILDGLTYREISEALGAPLGTVAYWVRETITTVAARLKDLK